MRKVGSEGKQTTTSIPHSEECSLPDLSCQLFHRAFSSPGRHLSKLLCHAPYSTGADIFPKSCLFERKIHGSQHSSQATFTSSHCIGCSLFVPDIVVLTTSYTVGLTTSYTVGLTTSYTVGLTTSYTVGLTTSYNILESDHWCCRIL